ncbi:transposase family protein [Streptomyces sp. LHD-70]|uniref:transposase family protein n=1 Tax=Streptomyces sp. LHD-70 TaxID=3072140 RepID=UPI00280F4DB4|nr:transposase family protein [Streptomyces sp. LHD-70]MDQ8708404.1 transposase family protein [Streptomyces sp. LHD-70]
MGGVLRAEPKWVETFTGLRMRQFERLLKVVRERGGNGPGGGRPWCLPLADRVLLVAVYYRTNLTMRQLAPLFGCSPATVCRVIQRLRPLLAIEQAARPADMVGRLRIVDGTLVPVRDRKVGASSRNYRFSANVQVIIDADTRLVIAAARPVPGNTSDAKAWRDSGLALLPGEEEGNAEHRRVRARVEHAFARMKRYKILRDCRQRGTGLHHAVQAIAHMHNLALAA